MTQKSKKRKITPDAIQDRSWVDVIMEADKIAKITELSETISLLKKQLEAKTESNEILATTVLDNKTQSDALIAQLQESNEELKGTIALLQLENETASKEQEANKKLVSKLNKLNQQVEKLTSHFNEKINDATKVNAELQQSLTNLQNGATAEAVELNRSIENLNKQLSDMRSELDRANVGFTSWADQKTLEWRATLLQADIKIKDLSSTIESKNYLIQTMDIVNKAQQRTLDSIAIPPQQATGDTLSDNVAPVRFSTPTVPDYLIEDFIDVPMNYGNGYHI